MTNGQPKPEPVSNAPASIGLRADARLRGTAVTLAAAARSSGGAIDITKDVRVGTSICDNALRTNSRVRVIPKFERKALAPGTNWQADG
jgi:hypothetical protein